MDNRMIEIKLSEEVNKNQVQPSNLEVTAREGFNHENMV